MVAPAAQPAGARRPAAVADRPHRGDPPRPRRGPARHHPAGRRRTDRVGHLSARLATLGPAATLARGYAVVQAVGDAAAPRVLRSVHDGPAGTRLRIRVSDGALGAVSSGDDGS